MRKSSKILIVESDQEQIKIYKRYLNHHYNLKFVTSLSELGKVFDSLLNNNPFDLIISEIYLSDGYLNEFISHNSCISLSPLMIISDIDDLLMYNYFYSIGVEDYILKGFSQNELLAKVDKSLKKQQREKSHSTLKSTSMNLDQLIFSSIRDLTQIEYSILRNLVYSHNQKLEHEILIKKVWEGTSVSKNTLSVHLTNIRKKISKLQMDIKQYRNGQVCLLT